MTEHRYVFLDGLRGLAALMVVVFHATQHTAHPLAATAYFSVDVFFCLSGYVLAKAYGARILGGMGLRDFALRRLVRLHPMFLAGLAMGVVVLCLKTAHGLTDYDPASLAAALSLNAFFLPYLNGHAVTEGNAVVPGGAFPFNDPEWSLFYELAANALFILVLPWASRGRWRVAGIAAAAGAVFAAGILAGAGNAGWGSTPAQLGIGMARTCFGFFAGVALAAMPDRPFRSAPANLAACAGVSAWFLALCLLPSGRISFAIAIACVIPLVHLASRVRLAPGWAATCGALGALSYPLYCVHYPILGIPEALALHPDAAWAAYVPLTTGIAAIVVAAVLARFYDIPVRARLDALRSRLPSARRIAA